MHLSDFPKDFVQYKLMCRLSDGTQVCHGTSHSQEILEGTVRFALRHGDDSLSIEPINPHGSEQLELASYALHRRTTERVEPVEVSPHRAEEDRNHATPRMQLPRSKQRSRSTSRVARKHRRVSPLIGVAS